MKAIVSVSDRTGLVRFAKALVGLGVEVFASDTSLEALQKGGVSASPLTNLSERAVAPATPADAALLGILSQSAAQARAAPWPVGVELVVVNLRPFEKTLGRRGSTAKALAQIEVGEAALLRAAARDFERATCVVDPDDYGAVLDGLRDGGLDLESRRRLAAKAFAHLSAYDAEVAGYLRGESDTFPRQLTIALAKRRDLPHGENPHQRGALYAQVPCLRPESSLVGAKRIAGGEPSFNDLLDLDVALDCVRDFAAQTVVVVRHSSPTGLACGEELAETYRRAHDGDPRAAVGATLGLNRPLDARTAVAITDTRYESIVAPEFASDALAVLAKSQPSLRLYVVDPRPFDELTLGANPTLPLDFKRVSGGFLVQTGDILSEDEVSYRVAGEREPTLDELTDLLFAWRGVKHVRSDAVVLARRLALVGVGTGQPTRADATDLAIRKAGQRTIGSVLASDAPFTSLETLEAVVEAGVTAIIQPGGTIRDEEITKAANRHHLALVLTGYRHIRH